MRIGLLTILKETLSVNHFNKLRFLLTYGKYIPVFLKHYHRAYIKYIQTFAGSPDEREDTVRLLLLNAFNSILVSSNLLIQSLFVPSGNLMRQLSESIACAILFSAKEMDYFTEYLSDKAAYRFDRLVNELEKKVIQAKLSLDQDGIQNMLKIHRFYHGYSHSTVFSMSLMINFSRKNKVFLGPIFDSRRDIAYKIEIRRRISACALLVNVIELCKRELDK